jgi:hypothetical protein
MDQDSEPDVIPSHGRRTFLKRAAVGGAVVWATPAILSVASAGAASGPPPPPGCTTCAASSYNALVTGTVLNAAVAVGPTRSSPPDQGSFPGLSVPGVISTGTLTVNSGQAAAVCSASATLDSTTILAGLISTGVLGSSISWPCDCSAPTVTTNVAGLTVAGNTVAVTGAANQHIATITITVPLVSTTTVDIVANEQFCNNGLLTANALAITVKVFSELLDAVVTNVTIILGHSQVNNGCACPGGFPTTP